MKHDCPVCLLSHAHNVSPGLTAKEPSGANTSLPSQSVRPIRPARISSNFSISAGLDV